MGERDFAKSLIDRVPENRLVYGIAFLQGAAVPDNAPDGRETEAIQNASKDFFRMLDNERGA